MIAHLPRHLADIRFKYALDLRFRDDAVAHAVLSVVLAALVCVEHQVADVHVEGDALSVRKLFPHALRRSLPVGDEPLAVLVAFAYGNDVPAIGVIAARAALLVEGSRVQRCTGHDDAAGRCGTLAFGEGANHYSIEERLEFHGSLADG